MFLQNSDLNLYVFFSALFTVLNNKKCLSDLIRDDLRHPKSQNFPGGACPQTPLDWLVHSTNYPYVTGPGMLQELATPLYVCSYI